MRGNVGTLELARAIIDVLEGSAGAPAALATVVGRSGSAPQALGARLLLREDGRQLGTVGGGAIELKVLEACRDTLRDGAARRIDVDLVRDLGMCCGGRMEVFVEYLQAQRRLFLVGAGHVAQALAPIAVELGFAVHVLDDRPELLVHPAFEGVERLDYDADELAAAIPDLSERDFVLIVTRDHQRDEQALAALVERPHAYLGMIGSRRKVHAVLGRVLRRHDERGRPRPDLSRVHAPVGLALGGRTPIEIAVSIAAELVAVRQGGDGRPLSIAASVAARVDPAGDKAS
jgi:xanthine dehydrogenase accessory factor